MNPPEYKCLLVGHTSVCSINLIFEAVRTKRIMALSDRVVEDDAGEVRVSVAVPRVKNDHVAV